MYSDQPTKRQKIEWASFLCESLKEAGLKATHGWDAECQTVFVRYRVSDRTWAYWKSNPEAFGGKPEKKIQELWLLSSTTWAMSGGPRLAPIQRWQCYETEAVIEGRPYSYATNRAIKI